VQHPTVQLLFTLLAISGFAYGVVDVMEDVVLIRILKAPATIISAHQAAGAGAYPAEDVDARHLAIRIGSVHRSRYHQVSLQKIYSMVERNLAQLASRPMADFFHNI
jgi:hypothetical protein